MPIISVNSPNYSANTGDTVGVARLSMQNGTCIIQRNILPLQRKSHVTFYMPTINTYRFSSGMEPSDEVLDALMREVAKEAKARYAAAHTAFFEQIYTMPH